MKLLLSVFMLLVAVSGHCQSKTYSFVFLHKKSSQDEVPKEQLEKIMAGHLANIERLANEGKLIAAGPFEGGGGIFILNTTTIDQANEWLSTDPGIKANRWDVEILPYTPRFGSVCAAKEPYEMVTYKFIRLIESKDITEHDSVKILLQHNEYIDELIRKGDIITAGVFERDGSILVLKDDTAHDLFESDPAVQHGIISVESKKLWIAKGSFCEP